MRTILRINGSNKAFFQPVTGKVEFIKNERIADYSAEFKRYYVDLAKSGDLARLEFDHNLRGFMLDLKYGELSVETTLLDSIQKRDFDAHKKAFAAVDRIEKNLNYDLLVNDKLMIKILLNAFKVQAVFIEIDGERKTMNKKEAVENIDLIFSYLNKEG